MTAATLYGFCSAALIGLGLYGLIAHAEPLRKILAFNLIGGGVFLLLGVIAVGGEGAQRHRALVVRAGIGEAHFVQTVFSPLSVIAFLLARSPTHHMTALVEAQYDAVRDAIHHYPSETHHALRVIAQTLAGYAAACLEAGASGIFFAIVKLARRGVLSREEYAEFGRPYDLMVLEAARGAPFNQLHVCGERVYFADVADYPVRAINWAAVGQGNPALGEAQHLTRHALIGGVDELHTLQTGTPEDVIAEARAAIHATGGRHMLLSPGCGTAMDVPEANLRALRQAASG